MRIADIVVQDRHRRDVGDLKELARSIENLGLLHPVVVTPERRLIAGLRRLRACESLGWQEIAVTVVGSLEDGLRGLVAERDENLCRLPMKPSELVALGRAIEAIERPKARAEGHRGGRGQTLGPGAKAFRTDEVVAEAIGMSGRTYRRAKAVVTAAEEGSKEVREVAVRALEQMDQTGRVRPAHESLQAAANGAKAKEQAPNGDVRKGRPIRKRLNVEQVFVSFRGTVDALVELDFARLEPANQAAAVKELTYAIQSLSRLRRSLRGEKE